MSFLASGCFHLLALLSLLIVSKTESFHRLTPESLPFIQRQPCYEPQQRCSFKEFGELRREEKWIEEWMVILYFDFERHSSHRIIVDFLNEGYYVKFFRHQIMFGKVNCNATTMQIPAHANLCKDRDPSAIYGFQKEMDTKYWWSVLDIMSHRSFVIGNFLTLRYKNLLKLVTGDFDDETVKAWESEPETRKYMLVVHMPASQTVSFTDRVKSYDFLGIVMRTIPGVHIIAMSGTNLKNLEFSWYDSRWCPNLHKSSCSHHQIHIEDFDDKDADEFLCEIEKFSAGIDQFRSKIDLRPQSPASRWEEQNERLLFACPFFFVREEGEKLEDLHRLTRDVPVNMQRYLAVIGDRNVAINTLISHGADLEFANSKILFKYHSAYLNHTNTDVFTRMTTAAGLQAEIVTYNGSVTPQEVGREIVRIYSELHYALEYSLMDDTYTPYEETDELFQILSSTKALPSEKVPELKETTFSQRISAEQPPAIVLFYVTWSSPSLVTRNIIFPSATSELLARFNRSERLYAVNCFDWNNLCQKQNITQYPTVKIFHKGSAREMQTVVSLAEVLREAVMTDLGSLLETRSETEVAWYLNCSVQLMDHAVLAVGIKDSKTLEEFRRTSVAFNGKAIFISAQHEHLPKSLRAKIADNSITSVSARLKPDLVTKESPLDADLPKFVIEARFDRVMGLTWSLFQEFQTTKRQLLILLVLEMIPKLECFLSKIAIRWRGQFHVTWLHATPKSEFPIFKGVEKPTLVLPRKAEIHRWVLNETHLSASNCVEIPTELDQWLADVIGGRRTSGEFVTPREYPPNGVHVNCVSNVYPPLKMEEAEKEKDDVKSSADSAGYSPAEMSQEMEVAKVESVESPHSSAVHGRRDEL